MRNMLWPWPTSRENPFEGQLKAMELLKRAHRAGEHQFAQYQLGKLLLQGEDVPKDVVAAVHWLTASAMHGKPICPVCSENSICLKRRGER